MKHFKRLFSYLVALTMVLSLAAFAGVNVHAASHTITINTTSEKHTYEAYRIFKGTYLKSDTSEYLGDIDWDTDYVDTTSIKNGKTLIQALHEKNEFSTVNTVKDVAEVLGADDNKMNDSTAARDFAQIVSKYLKTTSLISSKATTDAKPTITVPGEGYYLVKDKDDDKSTTENKAYTRFIVQVVGTNVTVTPKTDTPSVSKTVQDDDKNEGTSNPTQDLDNYGKTADHNIGEEFNYKLVATIPNTNTSVNDYQSAYKLVFHDTMYTGLTYKGVTSVKVSDGSQTVDVTGYDVKKENGTELKNPTAATTSDLNWKVTVANLKDAKSDTNGLDLTKSLTVTVIYKAELNEAAKIATPNNKQHNDNEVQLEYSNNPNAEGQDTPTGKTTKDTAYVFTYELDNTKVDKDDQNTKLDGAEFELKKGDNALKFTYDENKKAYRYDPATTAADATKLVSGHNQTGTGIFNIIGLDAGTYTLHETKAPDGYNTMADVTIKIEASHKLAASPDVTLTFKKDSTNNNGNAFTIENGKGSILPSTGGMGTTLLYAAGGILVACAVAYVMFNKKHAK